MTDPWRLILIIYIYFYLFTYQSHGSFGFWTHLDNKISVFISDFRRQDVETSSPKIPNSFRLCGLSSKSPLFFSKKKLTTDPNGPGSEKKVTPPKQNNPLDALSTRWTGTLKGVVSIRIKHQLPINKM